jgi:hypothetical protein
MIFPFAELRQWEDKYSNVNAAKNTSTVITLAEIETATNVRTIKPKNGFRRKMNCCFRLITS